MSDLAGFVIIAKKFVGAVKITISGEAIKCV